MENEMAQENQKAVTIYFLVLFAVILGLIYYLFNPFFHTLVIGLILSGLFYPVYRKIEGILKGRKIMASLLTCQLVFLTIFLPLIYFVLALSSEAYALYLTLTDILQRGTLQSFLVEHRHFLDTIMERLNSTDITVELEHIERNVGGLAKNIVFFIYERGTAFISNLTKFFIHFLFLLVILFYLFIDGPRFRNFLFSLSPLPDEEEQFLMNQFNSMAKVVLVINGFSGIIQGLFGGIGFWVCGLPSPFLWGCIMAILAFLPVIGISFIYIPAGIFLVLSKQYLAGILFLFFFAMLSLSVEYLLKPRLVGQQAEMHTLVILLAILGGLSAFGVLGILYGPLIMTAFFSLVELYKKTYESALLGKG